MPRVRTRAGRETVIKNRCKALSERSETDDSYRRYIQYLVSTCPGQLLYKRMDPQSAESACTHATIAFGAVCSCVVSTLKQRRRSRPPSSTPRRRCCVAAQMGASGQRASESRLADRSRPPAAPSRARRWPRPGCSKDRQKKLFWSSRTTSELMSSTLRSTGAAETLYFRSVLLWGV